MATQYCVLYVHVCFLFLLVFTGSFSCLALYQIVMDQVRHVVIHTQYIYSKYSKRVHVHVHIGFEVVNMHACTESMRVFLLTALNN